MKKVINSLLYNTETAKFVGEYSNGYAVNDFNFFQEVLYKKKTGEYFIYGHGGAMSKYAVWTGNSGGDGEEIRPYTFEEAREWAEEHLDADEYIAEFGKPEESPSGKVALNLSVLPTTKAVLEKQRQETGKSISQLIDELVNDNASLKKIQ